MEVRELGRDEMRTVRGGGMGGSATTGRVAGLGSSSRVGPVSGLGSCPLGLGGTANPSPERPRSPDGVC